jgi:hypothetical protein
MCLRRGGGELKGWGCWLRNSGGLYRVRDIYRYNMRPEDFRPKKYPQELYMANDASYSLLREPQLRGCECAEFGMCP